MFLKIHKCCARFCSSTIRNHLNQVSLYFLGNVTLLWFLWLKPPLISWNLEFPELSNNRSCHFSRSSWHFAIPWAVWRLLCLLDWDREWYCAKLIWVMIANSWEESIYDPVSTYSFTQPPRCKCPWAPPTGVQHPGQLGWKGSCYPSDSWGGEWFSQHLR